MTSDILEPIAAKVRERDQLRQYVSCLSQQYSELERRLEDHRHFNVQETTASLSAAYARRTGLAATSSQIKEVILRLDRDISARSTMIVSPMNIFRYFNSDQGALRAEIARLEKQRTKALEDCQTCDAHLQAVDETIGSITAQLTDHHAFNADAVQVQRSELTERIRVSALQIEALDHHLSSLEQRCGKQIEALRTTAATTAKLEVTVQTAKAMVDNLSSARSGSERATIHQECERRWGHGSPNKVVYEASGQLRRAKTDVEKIEKRLKECLRVLNLRIERVVIDGNNACYRGGEFIRLTAVTHIVDALSKDFGITVVFDASIRRLLGMDDAMIRNAIGDGAQVLVAPSRTAADRFALEIAEESDQTFVLSNDRFSDFADFAVVAQNRLIRFLIAQEHVSIPDLERVIPLPTGFR